MPVNDLSFNQLSTVLNAIVNQATGQSNLAPVNYNEFVSVGTTALMAGYDPLNTAISQVLGRTIFSTRPYSAKFRGLQVSNQQYGNITRKLSTVDKPFHNDNRFALVDGQSIDMFKVNKPKVVQENFYGANVYSKSLTVYKDQLDCAFRGPDEFAQFISMIMGNASDMIEQAHEATARATIANLIIGTSVSGNDAQVVHLLTEYKAATGLADLTPTTVMQPANYDAYMKWVFARIETASKMLTERTSKFHTNIEDSVIMRHTPRNRQKVYLSAQPQTEYVSRVLADAYHDNYLRYADHEAVNFWQSINSPYSIQGGASYMNNAGAIVQAAGQEINNIFGLIFDEDAAGYTVMNQWTAPTPFNADGGYTNYFWHFTDKYWNSFTENCILFLND